MKRGPPPRRTRLKRSTKPIRARKKDPSKRRFAKHRDEGLIKFVKKWWGCWICQRRPADPAHIVKRSRGSDDRNNVLPLCRTHHSEQEGHNAEFEAKYEVNLAAVARMVTEVYDRVGPDPGCADRGPA